jgi:hypothetical protein
LDQLILALSDQVVDVRQSNEGPSMLFAYDVSGTLGHYRMTSQNISVSIASEGVRQHLAVKYWKKIMETLNPNNSNYSGNSIQNRKFF